MSFVNTSLATRNDLPRLYRQRSMRSEHIHESDCVSGSLKMASLPPNISPLWTLGTPGFIYYTCRILGGATLRIEARVF
ncbi:hypothetical protein D9757_001105 [Collybiopsis confluens]|uniref:Uncharacterized protein n=1 Tax=Collybiopsis confluens TaxID=2823264 RepID=A0A8H5I0Q8_9AGAR|nr:hypothetical protein D9757_001105 [Collybiopsis confluens]